MRILLCNDDGYQAPGIVALHAPLYVSSALEGGSTALRLLHTCPVPVLLVTPSQEDEQKSEE